MADAVTVDGLVKRYRGNPRPAVDGLSFTVRTGEVFGLLGPNGAGKTTTIGVLTTRVLPTAGKAFVHGVDVVGDSTKARQLLAVVPQRNNLDRSLNVRQNLLFHAAYHGVPRSERHQLADRLLDRMGLGTQAKSVVDKLSGGQAQRVMIARALMHRPKVMFLDEPSTGLDPQARLFVHDRVMQLREDGITVVLTTHDMDEAAKLCDRVGIVDHGKLLTLDTPTALTRSIAADTALNLTIRLEGCDYDSLLARLSAVDSVQRVERIAGGGNGPVQSTVDGQCHVRLYVDGDPAAVLPAVLGVAAENGAAVTDLGIGKPSLEDVFIHLTGRELR